MVLMAHILSGLWMRAEAVGLVRGFQTGHSGSGISHLQALCVVWTTPLVATLGMSLTIPLAMVADMLIHGRHYSAVYVLGSVQVFAGFVIANIAQWLTQKLGF
ncbi:hypothetical protein Taro_034690 [Colocasia esculenta]|uniref:Uncharacterized protein n=1 Tax=Colocasia esculenta TaxID=4460 RepID=A0A843VX23_COLES|nr:hypothetical protein [Colocasia esculenta]